MRGWHKLLLLFLRKPSGSKLPINVAAMTFRNDISTVKRDISGEMIESLLLWTAADIADLFRLIVPKYRVLLSLHRLTTV